MLLWSVAFICGVIVLYCIGALLAPAAYPFVIFLILVSVFHCRTRVLSFFLIGLLFASFRAELQLEDQLPQTLSGTFSYAGFVCSPIVVDSRKHSWDLCDVALIPVATIDLNPAVKDANPVFYAKKLRVSQYFTKQLGELKTLPSGGYLKGVGKFKAPHGAYNRVGFHYETWLFGNAYAGTGSLKTVGAAHESLCEFTCAYWRFRNKLVSHIKRQFRTQGSENVRQLLLSLTVGEKPPPNDELRQLFNVTGTTHLLVVSGLHVTMVGGFALFSITVVGFVFRRTGVASGLNSGRYFALIASNLIVFAYAGLVGLTLPSLRAALMYLITSVLWLGFQRPPMFSLIVAIAILLVISPSFCLNAGFWLSVIAVCVLIFFHANRPIADKKIILWVKPHIIMFLCFSPILMWFQIGVSTIALVANLIAVPIVSLLLLPLGLISVVFSFVSIELLTPLFYIFDGIGGLLILVLKYLSTMGSILPNPAFSSFAITILVLALAGVLCFPIRFILKIPVILVLLGFLFLPGTRSPEAKVHMFDVGQGLSVYIRNEHDTFVYDFGNGQSPEWGVGHSIVSPNIRADGVDAVDLAVISHWDADHAGGWPSFQTRHKVHQLIASSVEPDDAYRYTDCAGFRKVLPSGMDIKVLWPFGNREKSRNNSSCVLQVTINDMKVLLPGDISREVELKLVRAYREQLQSDILVLPHHGSRSSSSWPFLKTVKPKLALISAGYHNQFGHPHREVLQRLNKLGITTYNTARSGEVIVRLSDDQQKPLITVEEIRKKEKRFWIQSF